MFSSRSYIAPRERSILVRRSSSDPAYSPDQWRRALREAMEKAAALEAKLETVKTGDTERLGEYEPSCILDNN